MEDLTLLLNCSVPKDVFSLTDISNDTVTSEATKAVGFGTITGILISLLINGVLSFNYSGRKNSAVKLELFEKQFLLKTLVLVILVLLLPTFLVLLTFAMCYKSFCSVIIKRKDKHFVSFLDSFDVFWNLEGDSVINILGVIESDSPEALVDNMKYKLQNFVNNKTSDKIFYRRNEEYGFYYWRRNSMIDLSQYIEIIEIPDRHELGVRDLEDLISDLSNKSLPYDDEALFKILITKQRVGNHAEERGEYGIIFRIHHSVGDGVALIEFLCESLADKTNNHPHNIRNMPKFRDYDNPSDLLDMIKKLCDIPLCVADLVLRKPDDNILHGPSLTGMKCFKWTESDENLLLMVKEIKHSVDHLNFSDIIVTALSGGLNNYFIKTMAHVPEDVAVIIPVRYPPPSLNKKHNGLTNDFIVSILDMPVKERNLDGIKRRLGKFRDSNEFLVNHYFMKLANILPKQILGPMFYSSQATVAFSNMPGPDRLTICEGNVLKKLVFFVPHKGNTGIGITAFCYGGVLRLAVSADKALVAKPEHLSYITEGMMDEIKRLHGEYVRH